MLKSPTEKNSFSVEFPGQGLGLGLPPIAQAGRGQPGRCGNHSYRL